MLRITRVALQRAGLLLFAWCCLLVAGCANFYVDKGLPEVAASELKAPSKPRPVQLFFQFETKGSANARATELLKAQVVDLVTRSGLFAAVQDASIPVFISIPMSVAHPFVPRPWRWVRRWAPAKPGSRPLFRCVIRARASSIAIAKSSHPAVSAARC